MLWVEILPIAEGVGPGDPGYGVKVNRGLGVRSRCIAVYRDGPGEKHGTPSGGK